MTTGRPNWSRQVKLTVFCLLPRQANYNRKLVNASFQTWAKCISVVQSHTEIRDQRLNELAIFKMLPSSSPLGLCHFAFIWLINSLSPHPVLCSSTECCHTSRFLVMLIGEGYILSMVWGGGVRGCTLGTSVSSTLLYTQPQTLNGVTQCQRMSPLAFQFVFEMQF